MNITETIKVELQDLCQKVVSRLGVKQGSIEIHCYRGQPKEVHIHDKSIKFGEQAK